MDRIAFLKNPVQEYAWGSKTFIPHLLGQPAAATPKAELWMGVHPKGLSQVLWDGAWISLQDLIQRDPENVLGKEAARNFSNRLPFLFKILAAALPLSIQVHPDLARARQGFARENRLQIPLDAPARNYRDENHKPEILCALTPFDALKGFRKVDEILVLFGKVRLPSLDRIIRLLREDPSQQGLAAFFGALLRLKAEHCKKAVSELTAASEKLAPSDPVFNWTIALHKSFPDDTGVFAPLLLNLIHLEPGQAIYIRPGELHSYLQGAGVELMANSDNVIRAGLTPKHRDVSEILQMVRFQNSLPLPVEPTAKSRTEWIYAVPSREFLLSRLLVQRGASHHERSRRSLEMMICTRGKARITDVETKQEVEISMGSSFLVPAMVREVTLEGDATVYRAGIPGQDGFT